MIKTFHFKLPPVADFSTQTKAFLPKLSGAKLKRYADQGIQLIEEYIDYHNVIFYRIQAHVQQTYLLSVETSKADYHLLYNLCSPQTIIIKQANQDCKAELPADHDRFIYFPNDSFEINLVDGSYLIYGALIDVGLIRPELYPTHHFLRTFRTAPQHNKAALYQSALWPVGKRTQYQLDYIAGQYFRYSQDNEATAAKIVYSLFDIAIYKDFITYKEIRGGTLLAQHAQQIIHDQTERTFTELDLSGIAIQCGVSPGRLGEVFKGRYHQTMIAYRDKLLVAKAKMLLANYSVKEVTIYCGFSHISSFSDYFLKHVGIRPSKFRS
ncbi:MAG: helix-turn-helix domain-containing protein [Sphingobacterium sp.]